MCRDLGLDRVGTVCQRMQRVPKYLEELGRGVRGNQSRTPQALNNIQTSLK